MSNIFYDDLNTMMMEIMMMTKYDDDERVGKRIRGRRNWPDSGAAGEAEGIWRRSRWGRRTALGNNRGGTLFL